MSEIHVPDRWAIIKITGLDDKPLYKVLGSWCGGFAGKNSWKMNSGIEKVELFEHGFLYHGYSGSIYKCYKGNYGTTSYSYGVFMSCKKEAESQGMSFELLDEKEIEMLNRHLTNT